MEEVATTSTSWAEADVLRGSLNHIHWMRTFRFYAMCEGVWEIFIREQQFVRKPDRPEAFGGRPTTIEATSSTGQESTRSTPTLPADGDTWSSSDLSLMMQIYELDLHEYEKFEENFNLAKTMLSSFIAPPIRRGVPSFDEPTRRRSASRKTSKYHMISPFTCCSLSYSNILPLNRAG